MATRSQAARKRKQRARDKYLPGLCNVVGVFLILLVFVIFLPITAPQLAGYEVFNVVSGSMQPYMPADSAIYVKPLEPEEVKIDDLAAFNGDDSVVVHRVVDIRPDTSEFVIKNDTSDANESDTISYDALIGRVEMHLPLLGKALAMYTSGVGKVYLVLTFACGVMLNVLADRLRDQRRIHQLQAAREALGAHGEGSARANELIEALAAPRRFSTVRAILVGALASVFICSAAVVIFVNYQHAQSDKIYDEAESLYVYDQTEGAEQQHARRVFQQQHREVRPRKVRARRQKKQGGGAEHRGGGAQQVFQEYVSRAGHRFDAPLELLQLHRVSPPPLYTARRGAGKT